MSASVVVEHIGGPIDGSWKRELIDGVPSTCLYYCYVQEESADSGERILSTRWGKYLKTRTPDGAWKFLWMQGEGDVPDGCVKVYG